MTSEVLLNIQNAIYTSVHTTAIIVKFITANLRQSFEKGRNNDDRHYRETGCYLSVKHGAFRGVHMIETHAQPRRLEFESLNPTRWQESTKSLELSSDLYTCIWNKTKCWRYKGLMKKQGNICIQFMENQTAVRETNAEASQDVRTIITAPVPLQCIHSNQIQPVCCRASPHLE